MPWSASTDDERVDLRNGLLLNSYYHRIFDRGVLHLLEDYTITLEAGYDLSDFSGFDKDAVERIVGNRINLPRQERHFPSTLFIRRRRMAAS
ncbi:MAG: HNH endonuclease [Trueperaceae bacterium]